VLCVVGRSVCEAFLIPRCFFLSLYDKQSNVELATMVRKLKYHEQKLLKKVDFLNVWLAVHLAVKPMLKFTVESRCQPERNQSHAEIPYSRPRRLPQVTPTRYHTLSYSLIVFAGIINFAARCAPMHIDCLFYPPKIHSVPGWRLSFCPSCTISVSSTPPQN
jgi:hypothetical protein